MNVTSPLFTNTLGHCAGIALFGLLFCLFFLEWKRSQRMRSGLSAAACALALLWNVGDLLALAPGMPQNLAFPVHAVSFASLILLPAILIHIWLQQRSTALWMGGYLISFFAATLHISGHLADPSLSRDTVALLLITVGFGGLTIICVCQSFLQSRAWWAGAHLAMSMLLLLPAIFFVYSGAPGAGHFHHIGIPLALFVLLFDYRFLVLDGLLRFAGRGLLATGGTILSFMVGTRLHFIPQNPFRAGLAFAGLFLLLIVLIQCSPVLEGLFTRLLQRRDDPDPVLAALRDFPVSEHSEEEFLNDARRSIAMFFECRISQLRDRLHVGDLEDLPGPLALLQRNHWPIVTELWAETALPLRFSSGDARLLLLGSRHGERPYRNPDLLLLARFGKIIEEQVERRRHNQTQAIASHAELRALQAQINPHFFFNALNTLYGTISRDNADARRLVLNLADVSHYLLRSDRTFVSLKEELAIINAYLEIQELRLGPRLTTRIQIDDELLNAEIPVLSIQPLVENAVKHGVALSSSMGFVGLSVRSEDDRLKIEVVNTGKFGPKRTTGRAGVGLDNVRRRLTLCYGLDADLHISCQDDMTIVCCSVPLSFPVTDRCIAPAVERTIVGSIMEKTA